MTSIKFRPHAVDFTPTLSFDLNEFEREADRPGATYFVPQVFGASLAVHSQFIYEFDEDLCAYRLLG